MVVSMPDRVANRLQGRVPPEYQPTLYLSNLISTALSAVTSDATAVFRGVGVEEVGGEADGWVRWWIGSARDVSVAKSLSTFSMGGYGSVGGEVGGERASGEGMRQNAALGMCVAVGELLGKISISGKARAVAAALLELSARERTYSEEGGRSGRRGKGESIVAFLAAAAAEEKIAVVQVCMSSIEKIKKKENTRE